VSAYLGKALVFDPRLNDTDNNGDLLTITSVSTANTGKGTVAITNSGSTITYTPLAATATGTDTFTYTVSDGRGGVSTSTITIDLYKPNEFTRLDVNQTHDGWDGDSGVPYTFSIDPNYQGGLCSPDIPKDPG